MKSVYCIIVVSLLMICSSCEEIIEIDKENSENSLTINALITSQACITAYVTKAHSIGEGREPDLSTLSIHTPYLFYKHQKDYYKDEVEGCSVSYQVNGGEMVGMTYDSATNKYVSQYQPKEGDIIRLVASTVSERAEASVVLPAQANVEVLNYGKHYSKRPDNLLPESFSGCVDSVMSIRLRINEEKSDERYYYRLQVRAVSSMDEDFYRELSDKSEIATLSEGEDWFEDEAFPNTFYASVKNSKDYYLMNDVFLSTDPLLQDNDLDKGYLMWDAGMTNIFDNHLFKNGSYEVEVSSRLLVGSDRHVEIELQRISREYYYYLRAFYLYRINSLYSSSGLYTSTIYVPTNVQGGWGVVGAMTQGKTILVR